MVIQRPVKLKMASPFTRLAETYESIFPAMRLYAADAVALAPPIASSSVVHDNGCGPGIVAAEILDRCAREGCHPPPRIEATDINPAMASAAARRGPSVSARVMDSRDLHGFEDGHFTHSFSNFVVLGMSALDMGRVVAEMHRTLRPAGGTAVLTAWASLGYVDLLEQVARRLNPAGELDTREAVLSERRLQQVVLLGGFKASHVEVHSITRPVEWKVWTQEGYAMIRRRMCDGFTRGWSRADADRLDDALRDRIARLAEQGRTYHMTAWVAVMRK